MTADSAQITRALNELRFHQDEAYEITRQPDTGGPPVMPLTGLRCRFRRSLMPRGMTLLPAGRSGVSWSWARCPAQCHARACTHGTCSGNGGRTQLLILVWDASPLPPVPIRASDDAENGRGLLLVDDLSIRWGHFQHHGGGKAVWALLDAARHARGTDREVRAGR
jgi:hypothetical protein